MTLPSQIDEQIRVLAESAGIGVPETVNLVLKYGLEAMREHDAQLTDLTERFRSEEDPARKERLGDELGRAIFG